MNDFFFLHILLTNKIKVIVWDQQCTIVHEGNLRVQIARAASDRTRGSSVMRGFRSQVWIQIAHAGADYTHKFRSKARIDVARAHSGRTH